MHDERFSAGGERRALDALVRPGRPDTFCLDRLIDRDALDRTMRRETGRGLDPEVEG
jgi:pyrimidine operon attenuation protein/uracil phosphoribosyltransferase